MIPFEALLPYAVMLGFFSIAGGGLGAVHYLRNGGKRDRWNPDDFDRQMLQRDLRLTGILRGQSDAPKAPEEFKRNSIWKLEKPTIS